ncbi:MFS family permease [Candidatus Methanophagaceae archaeon]|nr:MFS family permease [Methanophagales archaeon]
MKKRENPKPLYHDTNLQIIFAVTLIAVLGVSSISPAFYDIEQVFSERAVLLLIVVFTIPGVLLTPVLGVLADRLGRKKSIGTFVTAIWYRRWRLRICA